MTKIRFILLMLVFLPLFGRGQQHHLDSLVAKFRKHRDQTLQEKIYAHVDRNFYLTGETLWFKTYTVDGSFHQPVDVSKVAYAEIVDKGNFPVLQAKIELKDGMGNGSFFLPASLSSGHYKIRIYTNWMKNFDPEFYFDQLITIVNPFVVTPKELKKTAVSYHVDFFPEGGNLVAGIQSKVAFKITDASGKGVDCNGFILDQRGDTLASFRPAKYGIGSFRFTPEGDEKYKVVLDHPAGRSAHVFPEVHPAGYVMYLRDSGDFVKVDIASREMDDEHVHIFVHARQIIARAEMLKLRDNRASFLLKKSEIPGGVSHFTLFNEDLQPMCERLYFSYPSKALDIDVTSNARLYNFRHKVSVSLKTNVGPQTPVGANLSLSVYKVDSLSNGSPMNISEYFWLGSELAGTVESPGYYFSSNGPDVREAMDNLMLTHGWRRFNWDEILATRRPFVFLPEVNGHIINAVITEGGVKRRGIFTYLGSPGKIIRAYGSWSKEDGSVMFEIKDFYGPRKIIIQAKTDSTKTYEINVQNPFSTLADKENYPPFTPDPATSQSLLSRSIAMQVQDIYYFDQHGNVFEKPLVDSTAFYGKADATYFLDDYTRFPIMEEVMREYVPGVFVRKRRDGFHFIVVDDVNGGVLPGDPMVLLDGVPVFDVDDIMKVDPLRVKKLEVVKRQYYLGQAAFSGIVSYTTYQGDLGGLVLDPRSVTMDYDGLQLKREFYSPRYDQDRNSRLPDQRYLLYWQPDIVTGKTGEEKLEFYTSDVPGIYKVVVHGLSDEGFSGSGTYTFTVKASDNP